MKNHFNQGDLEKAYTRITSGNNFDLAKDSRFPWKDEKRFVFKELESTGELIQMFALRYLVYRYVNFIGFNDSLLDIDCFDLYSNFLGAYEVTGSTKRLIGTVRIVSADIQSSCSEKIKDIYRRVENVMKTDLYTRSNLFPIMQTFSLPANILEPLTKNTNHVALSRKPFEISRLAILPEYWGVRPKIERGLHELIILDAWKAQPQKNIYLIATHPRTKKRYKMLGFRIIPGTKERVYKPLKQLAIAMVLNLEEYLATPNPYRERCKEIFDNYIEKGYVVRD